MSAQLAISAEYVTASRAVSNDACLFFGVVTSARDANKPMYVFDSREEDSGQLRFVFRSPEDTSIVALLPVPVMMYRGLYVKLDGDTNEVTVLWAPIPVNE